MTDIVLNGIDGSTGEYFSPPLTIDDAAELARAQFDEAPDLVALSSSLTRRTAGLPFNVNPRDPRQAGWCVVFHSAESDDVKQAVAELVEHRRKQIANDAIVKVLDYQPDESMVGWLARQRVAPGSVDPKKVPLYVLLIGSPERIPFEFAHMLDIEYAVGRLDFETADEYRQYARSVIAYETGASVPNRACAAFWGPKHPNDRPTQLSSTQLIAGLTADDGIISRVNQAAGGHIAQTCFNGPDATKQNLVDLFHQPVGGQPALVFTASHGLGWPKGDARQRPASGALLAQEYPGGGMGAVKPQHFTAAADITDQAHVHGMVAFFFACWGGGVPRYDRYVHKPGTPRKEFTEKPFTTELPKRLLSHPNGGALAVVAHVERAWPASISPTGAGVILEPFENAIGYLLSGVPVGYALTDFNQRYATNSAALVKLVDDANFGVPVQPDVIADAWVARNDAEGYTLLGDPAVAIRASDLK